MRYKDEAGDLGMNPKPSTLNPRPYEAGMDEGSRGAAHVVAVPAMRRASRVLDASFSAIARCAPSCTCAAPAWQPPRTLASPTSEA